MARIQITDLPLMTDLSDDQIRGIYGGFSMLSLKIPVFGSKPILKPLPIKKPTSGSTVKKPSSSKKEVVYGSGSLDWMASMFE